MASPFVRCRECKNQVPTDKEKFCRCEVNPSKMTARHVSKDNVRSCKYFEQVEAV